MHDDQELGAVVLVSQRVQQTAEAFVRGSGSLIVKSTSPYCVVLVEWLLNGARAVGFKAPCKVPGMIEDPKLSSTNTLLVKEGAAAANWRMTKAHRVTLSLDINMMIRETA